MGKGRQIRSQKDGETLPLLPGAPIGRRKNMAKKTRPLSPQHHPNAAIDNTSRMSEITDGATDMEMKKPLSAQDALKLLDLLCTDDDFRSAFAASPSIAMKSISDEAAASCSTCALLSPLASKQEFQKSSQALLAHLQAHASFYVPHCFSANEVASSLRSYATDSSNKKLNPSWHAIGPA